MTEKARVIADLPDAKTIENDVRAIIENKFPKLKILGSKGFWHLGYEHDGVMNPRLTLHFWRENDTTLEFSHRDTHPFIWWVEYEVREKLANQYKGRTTDDAVKGDYAPSNDSFNSLSDYLNKVYEGIDWLIEESLNSRLPDELSEYR